MIVLNYGSPDMAVALARSICSLNHSNLHLVIVDNFSSLKNQQSLIERTAELSPSNLQLILLNRNDGYGSGNNIGLDFSFNQIGASAAIVLNPDVDILELDINMLIDFITTRTGEFLFTGLVYEEGRLVSMQRFSTILLRTASIAIPNPARTTRDALIVPGCAWGMSRELWISAGGFSEKYFLYFEELDYIFRYKRAKGHFPLVLVTQSFSVRHNVGGTTGISRSPHSRSLFAEYWSARSRILFCRLNLPNLLLLGVSYNILLMIQRLVLRLPKNALQVWKGSCNALFKT